MRGLLSRATAWTPWARRARRRADALATAARQQRLEYLRAISRINAAADRYAERRARGSRPWG